MRRIIMCATLLLGSLAAVVSNPVPAAAALPDAEPISAPLGRVVGAINGAREIVLSSSPLRVYDRLTDESTGGGYLISGDGAVVITAVGPDGASGFRGSITATDRDSGAVDTLTVDVPLDPRLAVPAGWELDDIHDVSEDGNVVVFTVFASGFAGSRLFTWNRATGAVSELDRGLPRSSTNWGARSASIDRTGTWVAFGYANFLAGCSIASPGCEFDIYRVRSNGTNRGAVAVGGKLRHHPKISGDGQTIVWQASYGTDPREVEVWSAASNAIALVPFRTSYLIAQPLTIDANGDRIGVVALSGTSFELGVWQRSTGEQRTYRGAASDQQGDVTGAGFTSDGNHLVFSDSQGHTYLITMAVTVYPNIRSLETLAIPVLPGQAPSGATAVVLNLTATTAAGGGYVTVWPCNQPRPTASSLNMERVGQTVANLVVSGIAPDGTVCVFTNVATNLIVDVQGWFVGSDYTAMNPTRLMDTRKPALSPTGAVKSGAVLILPVAGEQGIPSGTSTVSLNVTVTQAAGTGWITVWPCDQARPNASNVNYSAGQTVANAVISAVAADGSVCFYSASTAHLIVDVQGYLSPTAYVSTNPSRFLDTRFTPGDLPRPKVDGVQTLQTAGRSPVPAGATAAVMNVTATEPARGGWVTVYPCGPVPVASNLNIERVNQTVANLAIGRLSDNGRVCFDVATSTHLIVDVAGYFPAGGGYTPQNPQRIFDSRYLIG